MNSNAQTGRYTGRERHAELRRTVRAIMHGSGDRQAPASGRNYELLERMGDVLHKTNLSKDEQRQDKQTIYTEGLMRTETPVGS